MGTPDIGTAVREDRTRIDFGSLRAARRERVFAEMERRGLDACLFGREGNARYAAGQRRLWTSNTRAYLPSCVVVRATRRVHVMSLSASLDDAPEDLRGEDVYGRSFDPQRLMGIYAALPGLADARRVGVDGLSVPMRRMIDHVCPNADVVGAEEMMRDVRRVKLPAEVDCIRVAIAITESALQRTADELQPGIRGSTLQAIYLERMAELGTSTFAQQGTFHVARSGPAPPWCTDPSEIPDGSSVVLSGGSLWSGYEGSLGRTWWCGEGPPDAPSRALQKRWCGVMDGLLAQCRAGNSGSDLREAYEAAGELPPARPIAYAVGLGHEGPITEAGTGSDLVAGMAVALRGWVTDGTRGHFGEEMVHVTSDAPEVLTKMSHGPIARAGGGST